MKRIRYFIAFSCLAALLGHGSAFGKGSVINSPHNFSVTGGEGGKHGVVFSEEQRICSFCHVPHNAKQASQLWSRELPPESSYTRPYYSTTLKASPKPDKPTGASRLCLSCHDGSIALSEYVGSPISAKIFMPSDVNPTKNPNLTSDLRDDHPISFDYTDALAALQGELASPSLLPQQIALESGVRLECTTCHDPHNNEFGNFLVIDNKVSGTPLCVVCHKIRGWAGSAHNPDVTSSLGLACLNCHYVHNAPGLSRLLHSGKDEENCYLSCHNAGAPPAQDVATLFTNTTLHRHPVNDPSASGVHDEDEFLPAQNYHVQCVDCHNPHQANGSGMPLLSPPNVNGPLVGVRKDSLGGKATYEFEICFKCHAGPYAGDFSGRTEVRPNRQVIEADNRKRFDNPNTASSHPVMDLRRGDGSSLLVPFDTDMKMIYCSDCHGSDQSTKAGGAGPNGPHGSYYEHILIARYEMPLATSPPLAYSANLYALCYRCHSESFIMGTSSGFVNGATSEHMKHVQERGTPCFACHDPHGISLFSIAAPPPTVQNNAHLINFSMDYASGPAVPVPQYIRTGLRTGSCTVNCHTIGGTSHAYAP